MTIEQAIERLKELYEIAIQNKAIKNPTAWALYQTWRIADRGRRGPKPRNGEVLESHTIDGIKTTIIVDESERE